jgi:hypothetical protein
LIGYGELDEDLNVLGGEVLAQSAYTLFVVVLIVGLALGYGGARLLGPGGRARSATLYTVAVASNVIRCWYFWNLHRDRCALAWL